MSDNKNTISKTINGIEYTIVMDMDKLPIEALRSRDDKSNNIDKTSNLKANIDDLYRKYEKMRLSEPTVLDEDDIYPRSYQWRMGDRYDMGKVAALEEALKSWKKIEETEAYSKYVETISKSGLKLDSWD